MAATTTEAATFEMAERLLTCAHQQLAETDAGAPPYFYVATGAEIAWDTCECGQLTVHMVRAYPSDNFPVLKQVGPFNRCEAQLTVAEYVVTILRCGPTSGDRGEPPTPAEMNAAARTDHSDRWAVRRGVACCLESDDPRVPQYVLIQEQLAVGDQGQCMGSELRVFVGFPNCEPC